MHWLHWFDVLLVLILAVGGFFCRYSGAMIQIARLLQCLLALVISSFLYSWPATSIASAFLWRPDIIALILYPIILAIVYFALSYGRRQLFGKEAKVDLFGRADPAIAVSAGALRAAALLLFVASWIHGRYATEADVREYEKFCAENLGGIQFPVLSTMRRDIFIESYSGRLLDRYAGYFLLAALPPPENVLRAEEAAKTGPTLTQKVARNRGKAPVGADEIINELENGPNKKEVSGASSNAIEGASFYEFVYGHLSLKGISGVGKNRLALINNQTLSEGETQSVKVDKQKVKVFLKEIRDTSVIVQVDGKPELIELKLPGSETDAPKN